MAQTPQEAELQGRVRSMSALLERARAELATTRTALDEVQASRAALEAQLRDELAAREAAEAARAYVKNVLLRAMEKGGINAVLDEALFPVIATSLQFSAEETRHIAEARASSSRGRGGWLG